MKTAEKKKKLLKNNHKLHIFIFKKQLIFLFLFFLNLSCVTEHLDFLQTTYFEGKKKMKSQYFSYPKHANIIITNPVDKL